MSDKLEMPVEQFAEAVASENARLIRRNEQLVSGPGGIMEMKQTIVDKEVKIERLEAEVERLRSSESLVRFIAADYHELSYEKAQWQRDDWKKRCRKLIEELESE